ncbi:MAG: SMP-30/gluconolactonase/LRE family protein [Bacteroidetes bacterium]|nr:SMP-30/gluconolactonase/LRE family protein [Bacteroidota bacterium]MDA1121264.1 SMP-30/gluconolactonase/LRE family protein [Bacteroidota bacterium]
MINLKAEVVLQKPHTLLGEGPVWDYRNQELWWVDITNGLLHCYRPQNNTNRSYSIGQMVGAVIPCEKSELLLAMEHGFAFFDPQMEVLKPIFDPESHLPKNRFNDAKCDPAGRLWAGTMMINEPRDVEGSLYCLDSTLRVTKKLSGITVSNGLAWNKAADKMYYIDTSTQIVQAFSFDINTGNIEKQANALKFDKIFPDGMCIDENDHLWVAFYGASKVACFDPESGEQLAEIKVPARNTTSCAFGGEDLKTLYITSAKADANDKWGGNLFAVKPGVRGMKADFYQHT